MNVTRYLFCATLLTSPFIKIYKTNLISLHISALTHWSSTPIGTNRHHTSLGPLSKPNPIKPPIPLTLHFAQHFLNYPSISSCFCPYTSVVTLLSTNRSKTSLGPLSKPNSIQPQTLPTLRSAQHLLNYPSISPYLWPYTTVEHPIGTNRHQTPLGPLSKPKKRAFKSLSITLCD